MNAWKDPFMKQSFEDLELIKPSVQQISHASNNQIIILSTEAFQKPKVLNEESAK